MAGNEGSTTKHMLGRCTSEESSSKPTQHKSAIDGFRTPERCTTEYPFLKRKAKEADQDQVQDEDEEHEKEKEIDEILATAKLSRLAHVVSVAAAESMVVDPLLEQDIKPQAEAEIVSEPQAEAEDKDVYDDEDDDYDYQDDPDNDGYDDEDEDDYEDDDYDYDYDDYDWESVFAKHRPAVRAALLSFPEAANLEPQELDAAVERSLEQSKPQYRDVAAAGKIRLLAKDIGIILAQQTLLPIIPHDLPSTIYPADMIQKSKERHKELLDEYNNSEDRIDKFQARIRRDLIDKGYAEVDEDYYDRRDRAWEEIKEEWNKIDFSRFHIASSPDGIIRYSEGIGDYER